MTKQQARNGPIDYIRGIGNGSAKQPDASERGPFGETSLSPAEALKVVNAFAATANAGRRTTPPSAGAVLDIYARRRLQAAACATGAEPDSTAEPEPEPTAAPTPSPAPASFNDISARFWQARSAK